MITKEILLTDLEIKLDTIVIKYKNLFEKSELDPKGFIEKNYETMRAELARITTDTLHQSIIQGVKSDEAFIFSVQKLNVGSVYKLLSILMKKE